METRAVIKIFFSLQGKAPNEIHAIVTEIFLISGFCHRVKGIFTLLGCYTMQNGS
jgi:hypothetical protein